MTHKEETKKESQPKKHQAHPQGAKSRIPNPGASHFNLPSNQYIAKLAHVPILFLTKYNKLKLLPCCCHTLDIDYILVPIYSQKPPREVCRLDSNGPSGVIETANVEFLPGVCAVLCCDGAATRVGTDTRLDTLAIET